MTMKERKEIESLAKLMFTQAFALRAPVGYAQNIRDMCEKIEGLAKRRRATEDQIRQMLLHMNTAWDLFQVCDTTENKNLEADKDNLYGELSACIIAGRAPEPKGRHPKSYLPSSHPQYHSFDGIPLYDQETGHPLIVKGTLPIFKTEGYLDSYTRPLVAACWKALDEAEAYGLEPHKSYVECLRLIKEHNDPKARMKRAGVPEEWFDSPEKWWKAVKKAEKVRQKGYELSQHQKDILKKSDAHKRKARK